MKKYNKKIIFLTLLLILVIIILSLSYSFVPLYKIFCQLTGYGGTVQIGQIIKDNDIVNKLIRIKFHAYVNNKLGIEFRPVQDEITARPGQSILAFYSVVNKGKEMVNGMATFNVVPGKAGIYFHKIQCFCFEVQEFQPREEVELPVYFYIDPEIDKDAHLGQVVIIDLAYTFYESREK
jgi:cytochrome c oxidase assembly protein subunit 11